MQIIYIYSVIGNIAYLMTKHLAIDINKSFSWYILYIKLPESSVQQLIFCKEFISDVNVKDKKIQWFTNNQNVVSIVRTELKQSYKN
jgi:hypothetical protein